MQVKISDERDAFISVASSGVKLLVKAIESNLEVHFQSMSRVSWSTWENVGDQSVYVSQIGQTLLSTAKIIKKNTSDTKYYRMFSEKLSGTLLNSIIDRMINSHVRIILDKVHVTDIQV